MKPFTVYLSESGGASAISAIKSFRKLEHNIRIITADSDNNAAGKALSDKFYQCPMASKDPAVYITWLNDIIRTENIDMILPTGEHDVRLLSLYRNNWEKTKIYVSSEKSINICQDKYAFYKELHNHFDLPITIIGDVFQKPRRSAGSRNTKHISNPSDSIIQEYLPGKEYTVDVFCDESSESMGTVVRERVVIKSGISTQNCIVNYENPNLVDVSEKLCKFLNLIGPVCVQFRKDVNGRDKIMEINPRLGGTSIVSTLANVNFAEMYYQLYHGNRISKRNPRNIYVSRYWEETVYEKNLC